VWVCIMTAHLIHVQAVEMDSGTMDDVYKIMTNQDFNDFFRDYRNEVDDVVNGKVQSLTMADAEMYYGVNKSDARRNFQLVASENKKRISKKIGK
jgi:hypothetical protein